MPVSLDLAVAAATFLLILPAELPDKSFVATLVLATRYGRLWVWLGAAAAFGVQMAIAVLAGQLLSLLPEALVQGAAALLFAIGAVVLIRGGLQARDVAMAEAAELAELEQAEVSAHDAGSRTGLRAFATAFVVLFTAEWGDLTQLIAAGQAARTGAGLSVFLGGWTALATVAGFGVLIGGWLQARIPLWRVRLVAGALLVILAVLTVVELVRG